MAGVLVAGAADVDVRFAPRGCRGVFEAGETPELTLVVSNRMDGAVRFEAKLRTLDYFGDEVASGTESLEVAAKSAGEKRIAYPDLKGLGFYCTVAEWKAGDLSGTAEGSFVKVGPRPEKPDRLFGVTCFSGTDLELFKRMGVGTKGLFLAYGWMEDWRRPGLENCRIGKYKDQARALSEAGIRVIGMVGVADNRFPTRYMKKVGRGEDPVANHEKFYADAEAYYKMIADEFSRYINDWSAVEEINLTAPSSPYKYEMYKRLTGLFSRAVKSVNPSAIVYGISVSGGDARSMPRFPYIRKLAPEMAGCLDGIAPDLYTDGQDYGGGRENLNSEQTRLRELMQEVVEIADRHGYARIAIDEKGPSFEQVPLASPSGKFSADIVAREYIILKTLPRVDHWLYFMFSGNNKWGMWDKGNPRQVVAAYAATARLMAHAEFVKGMTIHADIPCWTFRKDGKHFATLWYNGEKPLAFKLGGNPVEVRDAMGNEMAATGARDACRREVTLSSSPVYVYFNTTEELEKAVCGASFAVPLVEAMLEMKSSKSTLLAIRNKGGLPLSVRVSDFHAEPMRTKPEVLEGVISIGPSETKTVDLGFSASKIYLSLDADKGEPISVCGTFAPFLIKRIRGWNDMDKCLEMRLDDPVSQIAGYADLKTHKVYTGWDDLSVSARFGYDDEALCMEYTIVDDVHGNKRAPVDVWAGDSVQFCIDACCNGRTNLLGGKRGFDDDDFNFAAGLADGKAVLWCYMAGVETRSRMQGKQMPQHPDIVRDENAKITRYRIRIPFADLVPLKPESGRIFGMSFLAFDSDPPEKGIYSFRLTEGVENPLNPAKYRRFMFE